MPQVLNRIQQNLKHIRKSLKPFNLMSQWVRALLQRGNRDTAEKIFRLLIRLSKGRKASRTYLFRDSTERRESPLLILIQTTLKSEAYAEANFYFEQTIAYFQRELLSAPSDQRLLFEIGKTYLYWATSIYEEATHSHLEQSILYLEQALTANHNMSSDIHIQIIEELGESYFLNRMYKEGLQLLEEAVAKGDYSEKILLRLAALLEEDGSYGRALYFYDQALCLNPKSKASVLRTYPLLKAGNFKEAWAAYRSRGRNTNWKAPPNAKHWMLEPLKGKTILVYSEGGVGDELYFLAPFNDLVAIAENCILTCDPRHEALFKRSFPTVDIRPFSRQYQRSFLGVPAKDNYDDLFRTLPNIDYYCFIGDLGYYFRNGWEDFKKQEAYLVNDNAKVAYWKKRLDDMGTTVKIGLCWRSGFQALYREREYTTLKDWLPLLNKEGYTFINLMFDGLQEINQLEQESQESDVSIKHLADLDLKNDFDNVAALIEALDLVISVDTNIAELAGGLGQKTWRVINSPYLANHCRLWPGTEKDIWHPSMIQITSDPIGDTASLIAQVSTKLGSMEWKRERSSGY